MSRTGKPILRWLALPPWIILALGVLVTVAAAEFTRTQVERTDHARFDRLVSRTMLVLGSRLDTNIALLRGAAGLFAATGDVTPQTFHAYADRLELDGENSGIRGIGFAVWTDGDGGAARLVLPQATHPWPDELRPMSVISMLEPLDSTNQTAIGYDMYSERMRREAMDRARARGRPAASGKVTLIQSGLGAQPVGFIIYLPVFSGAGEGRGGRFAGWVYGPFRAEDFFRQALREAGVLEQANVQIYDGASNEESLLFSSSALTDGASPFSTTQTVNAAGRPWTVRVTANTGFHSNPIWAVLPVLAIGAALTGSIAFAAWLQSHALQRARTAETEALGARERAELLLKEVNHRVANSLQLVASLLDLQGSAMRDEGGRAALAATRARVMAVARVHQRLYVANEVQRVDLRGYLDSLTQELESSLDARRSKLRLIAEDVLVDAEQAVSAGIVVAELVTNAFKYAYPGAAAGEVRIRLARVGDKVRLSVEDDGVGLPARGSRAVGGTGLGMTIVKAMAQNLNAEIDTSSIGAGAQVALTFPFSRRG